MKCRSPFVRGMQVFPCGQCIPCRINRRRMWTHRIMLEALKHEHSSFVTLTYEVPPEGDTLVPKDLQDWLKRLRKEIEPQRIRYYAVGEYGDNTQRPHYHIALFGYEPCRLGQSTYTRFRKNCCPQCDRIRDTWGNGLVYVGSLEVSSAQYIAGYVTKKMTSKSDPRLNGRYPEFARMSLKPGIGADAVWDIVSTLRQFDLDRTQVDVPSTLRHGKKLLPLGRYLRRKIRIALGRSPNAPEEALREYAEEVRALLAYSRADPEGKSVAQIIKERSQGAIDAIEGRAKIFKGAKKI